MRPPASAARPVAIALLGLVSAAAVAGENHVVTTTSSFTFEPSNLTITQGDTVTFVNGDVGGFPHNVMATSGPTTFRCANGCDGDGQGGDGDLAGNAWSATVTFPTSGQVVFFCQAHGDAQGNNMAGVINIVIPVELQSFEIE